MDPITSSPSETKALPASLVQEVTATTELLMLTLELEQMISVLTNCVHQNSCHNYFSLPPGDSIQIGIIGQLVLESTATTVLYTQFHFDKYKSCTYTFKIFNFFFIIKSLGRLQTSQLGQFSTFKPNI